MVLAFTLVIQFLASESSNQEESECHLFIVLLVSTVCLLTLVFPSLFYVVTSCKLALLLDQMQCRIQ